MSSDPKFWIGFNIVKGIGPAKVRALLDHFGDLERAWHANERELKKIGFDKRTIKSFFGTRADINLDAEVDKLAQHGVRMLCWDSADYPTSLRHIPTSPPTLYIKGELKESDKWGIAIVGTRKLTEYGRQMTHEITTGLVRRSITIVSGLARGIDSIAHKVAVDMGGRTIAVLGSGIDQIYPPENRRLAEQIANGRGAIVSEYALGVAPEAKNFPPRNRIISALSLGSAVIEAGYPSGALITARFAAEQGRNIFAVPGNVNSAASKGTNKLIQDGAKLITSAKDILDELHLEHVEEQKALQLTLPESAEEAALIPHLLNTPAHVDDLSRATGMPSALVGSTLTLMELKGMVQQVGRMQYVLIREMGATYSVDSKPEEGQEKK
ncbi:MAG: DNA-processing protein DprA [Candidatus Promineifilaceae bacterium]